VISTEQQHDLLTVSELQAYLRIARRTAYALVQSGEIPSIRVGGSIRIPRAALERVLVESMERTDSPTPETREAGIPAQTSRDMTNGDEGT
jgi:excisionase family DNA binding protein